MADGLDGADDVEAGDFVGVGGFFAGGPLLGFFERRRIDDLLDVGDEAIEIGARSGFAGFFRGAEQIDG